MEPMSLLNMLAEIASEKLHSDPTVRMITKTEQQNTANEHQAVIPLPQNQGKRMTLYQVSTMSENSLLRLFSVSQANELKRKFYFTCRLIPQLCEATFHSFGSEDKARNLMKKHLKEHVQNLLTQFKDFTSQENYILHTVEKVSKNHPNDSKSSARRQQHKSEAKMKSSYEKENSSSNGKMPVLQRTSTTPNNAVSSNTIIKKSISSTVAATQKSISPESVTAMPRSASNSFTIPPKNISLTAVAITPQNTTPISVSMTPKTISPSSFSITHKNMPPVSVSNTHKNMIPSIVISPKPMSTNTIAISQKKLPLMNPEGWMNMAVNEGPSLTTSSKDNIDMGRKTITLPITFALDRNNPKEGNTNTFVSYNANSSKQMPNSVFVNQKRKEMLMEEINANGNHNFPPNPPIQNCPIIASKPMISAPDITLEFNSLKSSAYTTATNHPNSLAHDPQTIPSSSPAFPQDGTLSFPNNYITIIPNVHSKVTKRELHPVINITSEEEPPKKIKATEIIDIKVEDTIKLEVFEEQVIGGEHLDMTNSNISHDHGYIEFEDAFNNIKVEKEEVVESSDHSQHLEFNSDSSHPPSTSSPPSEPENQHKSADPLPSYPSEIPESQDSAKLKNTKRKGRLKGKGKFIGQSKDEKEMALSLIEKIKSQSLMQMENLECTICDPPRVFTAPSTLLSHYKSHAGIRPYVCSLCEAVFTRQHSLNYHLLIHSNQTRFTCDDCGRKFRHPSHFKEHRRRHTGESPYECMDCLMRFKTRNTYKRHLRTRHGKKLTTQGSIYIVANDDSEGTFVKEEQLETTVDGLEEESPLGSSQEETLSPETRESREEPSLESPAGSASEAMMSIKYPEMVPFSTQGGLYDLVKRPAPLECDAASLIKTSSDKEYHEMMPLEVLPCKGGEGEWSVLEMASYSSPVPNATGGTPAFPMAYGDEPPKSYVTFSSTEVSGVDAAGSVESPFGAVRREERAVTPPMILGLESSMSQDALSQDVLRPMEGSILNSLLTLGSGGGVRGPPCSPFAPPVSYIPSGGPSTDKWDSLMREVVSLSTAVKEKGESPPLPTPPPPAPFVHPTTPMKELSNNVQLNRSSSGKDSKEIYVLKYTNNSSGGRVAKVFKARAFPPAPSLGGGAPPKETKAILITSSVNHCGQKLLQSTPSDGLRAALI